MNLHSDAYRRMTELVLAAAGELCGGRVVAAHEGGYSAFYVPFCALATIEALVGERSAAEDPFLPLLADSPDQVLKPHQEEAIERAAALVGA